MQVQEEEVQVHVQVQVQVYVQLLPGGRGDGRDGGLLVTLQLTDLHESQAQVQVQRASGAVRGRITGA